MASLALLANSAGLGVFVSPWVDGTQDVDGNWQLPEYPCEIKNLNPGDPKNKKWKPGDFEAGVDNVDSDPATNQIREWAGQKLWEGERPPRDWDPARYSQSVQALLQVPHMPGQPVKEMFARAKALEPRRFQDRHFDDIWQQLPQEWTRLVRQVAHAERFGVHTEAAPAEWAGLEEELVPAAYLTPRLDTVTVCVGVAGAAGSTQRSPMVEALEVEYDYLELLYVKDQEGKIIQIVPFECPGVTPAIFCTFSFIPPKGTTSITPFASFKIRGVWKGASIKWDPAVGSDDMQWFTDMAPEMRMALADRDQLQGRRKPEVDGTKYAKSTKALPVLWPESSWEGNAAKARVWDQLQS